MSENIGAGPRIRMWRKKVPMKSFELAEKLKLSQGSLSDIENGKSNPSAPTIRAFIEHTDIDVFWMITGKRDYDPKAPDPDFEMYEALPLNTIYVSPGQKILLEGREL